MLNIRFVVLRFASRSLVKLAVKVRNSKREYARSCASKQVKRVNDACLKVNEAQTLVELDTVDLEKARTEALARVNIEYDMKIEGLQSSVDKARAYLEKQRSQADEYHDETGQL